MPHYDLPAQTLLQQSSARPISGEELEVYGKHAAILYTQGASSTLDEAIVETVKSAGLAPEQVRRVCEFANTHAFVTEHSKEGAASKYVHFEGGPASFSRVLQDLNDGGGGTVFDRGTLDYSHTPSGKTASFGGFSKTASAATESDCILEEAFGINAEVKAPPLPYANPLYEVHVLRDKLAGHRDQHTASISDHEHDLLAVIEELYRHVKQAAVEGVPLGHIVQAWYQVLQPAPEFVKAAFAVLSPRLQEEVFHSWDLLGASIEKTASCGLIANADHPIVVAFDAYCDVATKLASLRSLQQEAQENVAKLEAFERGVVKHYGGVLS